MKKKIFIFLFNGYADWEISYLTPEINKNEAFELIYFSKDGNAVTSMGGLITSPHQALSQMVIDEVRLLILPGGTAWERDENRELDQITLELYKKGRPIAAICAATTYLGKLGILNDLKHTSNGLNYLKEMALPYLGEKYYTDLPAITSNDIITASGTAPLEFAREIFIKLNIFNELEVEKRYQLFKNGVWSN